MNLLRQSLIDLKGDAESVLESLRKEYETLSMIREFEGYALRDVRTKIGVWLDILERLNKCIAVVDADDEAIREKARFYDYLRDGNIKMGDMWETISDECNPPYPSFKFGKDLDDAIAAALKRKG